MDVITVCACTYKRPKQLAELLSSLKSLNIPDGTLVKICIVDNDVNTSARATVDKLSQELSLPLKYVHESQPGIPAARNRALVEAHPNGFLAFVDDDETVHPDWLVELYKVAVDTSASFVQGPVEMTVEDPSDRWWLDTVFFRQKVFPNKSTRNESWSNNVLVCMKFVRQARCQFDNNLRYDGGSDTLFFQDLIRKGGTGRYASAARVFELQPKSRLSWKWALQRQYRFGITRVNTIRMRNSRLKTWGYCAVRSGGMFLWGMGYLVLAIFRGKKGIADSMAYFARGTGVLFGTFGARRLEYARKVGS